jgi:hypothetical protein
VRLCRDVAKKRLIVTALNAALGWWRSAVSFSEAMVKWTGCADSGLPALGTGRSDPLRNIRFPRRCVARADELGIRDDHNGAAVWVISPS